MGNKKSHHVCHPTLAFTLDNTLRRFFHNPRKVLEPHIRKGMIVLDLGCGPGFFTAELAGIVGDEGLVIAADLQQEMLQKVAAKIRGTDLEKRIETHLCDSEKIGLTRKVDFVLAFWMVHEVPDQRKMFRELRSYLNPGGRIWIIEPKLHVREKAFNKMLDLLNTAGLVVLENPRVSLSRSVMAGIGG